MTANDADHLGLQFEHKMFDAMETGESRPLHNIQAYRELPLGSDKEGSFRFKVGSLSWNAGGIRSVDVEPEYQRRGIATAMWQEGHRLASEVQHIPQPKHSSIRTDAGDAWARSVGGRLPRRKWFQM